MAPTEPSQPGQAPTQPKRDWIAILVTALPGIAALIAVLFTYVSVKATENQVQIAREGQITDRYNAAITNLGSRSIDVRLGGIYALQRLMQDSPRDQPTVIAVLCAFVRDRSRTAAKLNRSSAPATDIAAALTVVNSRNRANDAHPPGVDLDHAQLANGQLNQANLTGANLYGANLTDAMLREARLIDANLGQAIITDAHLLGANLSRARLDNAHLRGAFLGGAHLRDAVLVNTDLRGAKLYGADLRDAGLLKTDLRGADLSGADLSGAALTGAQFDGANLVDAIWPDDEAVPKGWQRDGHSGRLEPSS